MSKSQAKDALLSLHDIVHYYESDLPFVINLNDPVRLPNLIDLLRDYLNLLIEHRSLLGTVLLWKLPQYKRPVDSKTLRMQPLDPDALFRMKILDVYQHMLINI